MCGIIGYVGGRPCRPVLLAGLEKLEYRGYDSAGISVLEGDGVASVRAVGNLANLQAAIDRQAPRDGGGVALAAPPATIGLAHTRWATHGRVTEANAHPHSDTSERIHIVLNGIVENHARLRRPLQAEGHRFTSETDAEVVAHLIASHYDGDLAGAVRAAFAELRGHYAFVAMHADHPDELIGARKECPLVAGIGEGEAFLASSIAAFLADTRIAMPIENGEIVSISAAGVAITTAAGEPVDPEPDAVTWDADLRHLLPRWPRRSLRDRRVGPPPGRDGHRLRVPLPQSRARAGGPGDRHHPVGRDRRHPGGDAPGPRGGGDRPRRHQHDGQPGDPRRRRGALHPRPRGGSPTSPRS